MVLIGLKVYILSETQGMPEDERKLKIQEPGILVKFLGI